MTNYFRQQGETTDCNTSPFSPLPLNPPMSRPVIRIGVTGHRASRMADFDQQWIERALAQIVNDIATGSDEIVSKYSDLYKGDSEIRIISPLATGADSLIAKVALMSHDTEHRVQLHAPLPFFREHYENDFNSDNSSEDINPEVTAFRSNLEKATRILEIDGKQAKNKISAYRDVGGVMLNQSDLLVAVWDGQEYDKAGPDYICELAKKYGVAVIHVNPTNSSVSFRGTRYEASSIEQYLENLLVPLQRRDGQSSRNMDPNDEHRRARYFKQTFQSRLRFGQIWKYFRDLVMSLPTFHLCEAHNNGRDSVCTNVDLKKDRSAFHDSHGTWLKEWSVAPEVNEEIKLQIDNALLQHFLWADRSAAYYANLYRSAYVLKYLLAALAVFFALIGYALGWTENTHVLHGYENLWIGLELLAISGIIGVVGWARSAELHRQYLDARFLAENLRILRFMMPIGSTLPVAKLPEFQSYEDPQNSWVYWHLRAIMREAGMVTARLSPTHLQGYRRLLIDGLLRGQRHFHERNAKGLHQFNSKLHSVVLVLSLGTLVACAAHLVIHVAWLTLVAAFFPALAAALEGIRSQEDLQKVERRSSAMRDNMDQFLTLLADEETKGGEGLRGTEIRRIAVKVGECMTLETLDWSAAFSLNKIDLSV